MFFTSNYRVFRLPCIRTVDHFPSNYQLTFTTMQFSSLSLRHSSQPASLFLLDHCLIQDQDDEPQMNATLDKEAERRRKIGLARKGKVPWNKGRNHTAETRALIVNRTREALKDPKVRNRMFQRQTHAYSTDTRAKMVMGQKRAWKRRYKMIEDKNKFYSSWGECVAESAKNGLLDQQQLEWDSYEKMTSEIAFQQLQSAEEKENAKKMAKLTRAEEKRERRATQRKEKEEEVRCNKEAKIKLRLEAKKAKEELQVSRKLKAKITKIRRRKTLKGDDRTESVATKHRPAIEKVDLEWIQREKSRRDLSLADQIQAAKQRRSVNGGHASMTHQVDLHMAVKRLKPQSLLSFADEILAAKKKRAESAMKEALNGEDVATSRLEPPCTEKPDFDLMRLEKVQSMSSFADQIQAAKQKRAATKESVIHKEEDLVGMRREKVGGMLSFADQIRAAKEAVAHH